jgi:hypothetical protein
MVVEKLKLNQIIIIISLLPSCLPSFVYNNNSFDIALSGASQNTTPSIAYLGSDKYAICWTGFTSSNEIYYALYDITGSQIQSPAAVDGASVDTNDHCWVTADNIGNFVVIWMRRQIWQCTTTHGVFARYFASGIAVSQVTDVKFISPTFCSNEYFPILIFSGSYFYGCYASIVVKFDSSLTKLAAQSIENPDATKDYDYQCMLTSLGNGTIAVTYSSVYNSTNKIRVLWAILNESDLSVVKGPSPITVNYGKQMQPSIALIQATPNNMFVIVWNESDSGNLSTQFFDLDGTPNIISFYLNTQNTSSCPIIQSLDSYGFIISYSSSYQPAYQIFDSYGQSLDGEIILPFNFSDMSNTNIAMKSTTSSMIMVFSNTDSSKGFVLDYTNGTSNSSTGPTCKDFSIVSSQSNTKLQIIFDSSISSIHISTEVSIGVLRDITGNNLQPDAIFPANNIYYEFTNPPQLDWFTYYINVGDTPCKVTITPCYSSCYTCTTVGNVNDNQCGGCDLSNDFYPVIDKAGQCYSISNKPVGYYLSTNIWDHCYKYCKDCDQYPADETVDMKCILCITNYYPKEDMMSNCYTGALAGYNLVGNIYKKDIVVTLNGDSNCYPTCQTCSSLGTDSNHQCATCIANYFPKIDNKASCYTGDIPQYYFDGRMYPKCYYLCNSCSLSGTPSNNQCSSCVDGYYPKEDYTQSCFAGDQVQYYMDNGIYKRCYSTCLSCNTLGDEVNHHCLTCLNGYYPKIDSINNCYTDIQNYYYLDENNIYQKCYPTCLTCLTLGSATDNKCVTCLDNYYPKVDNLSSCFTGSQEGYKLESNIYQKCDNCSTSINLAKSCNPSPCLNNGVCSIKLSKVNCDCTSEFVGWICQYELNNLDLAGLVNKYYESGSEESILDLISILSTHFPINNDEIINTLLDSLSIYF